MLWTRKEKFWTQKWSTVIGSREVKRGQLFLMEKGRVQLDLRILEGPLSYFQPSRNGWQGKLFLSSLPPDLVKWSIQHQKLKFRGLFTWMKWLTKNVRHKLLSAPSLFLGMRQNLCMAWVLLQDEYVGCTGGMVMVHGGPNLLAIGVLALLDYKKREAWVLRFWTSCALTL